MGVLAAALSALRHLLHHAWGGVTAALAMVRWRPWDAEVASLAVWCWNEVPEGSLGLAADVCAFSVLAVNFKALSR